MEDLESIQNKIDLEVSKGLLISEQLNKAKLLYLLYGCLIGWVSAVVFYVGVGLM